MTYATQADMEAHLGIKEVIALTDRDFQGVVDAAVLSPALDLASDEIDGYLGGRYTLPLPKIPRLLTRLCCDIARYRLCGSETQETDPVRTRYKDAVSSLKDIRDGKMTLGLDPAQQPVATSSTVQIVNGNRTFSQSALDDY